MYSGRYEIKKYGRRNEYKSANGWGRWKLGDEIEGISKHGFADARWEKTGRGEGGDEEGDEGGGNAGYSSNERRKSAFDMFNEESALLKEKSPTPTITVGAHAAPKEAKINLFLMRHGESKWNEASSKTSEM